MGRQSTRELRRTAAVSNSSSPFGQNEWLVEEMYRKFRDDPSSVDPSWHEFLVDYTPAPPPAAPQDPPSPGDGRAAAAPKPVAVAGPPAAPAASAPAGNG